MSEDVDKHEGPFKPARDVTFTWEDGSVGFNCPCGVEEIILSDGGDMKRCDCGRVYRLVFYLEVYDPALS